MAVSLKFLSRAAEAVAHSPSARSPRKAGQRILGEASPKTPKTPVRTPMASPCRSTKPIPFELSPARFVSPFFEDFDLAAKPAAPNGVSPQFAPPKAVVDGTMLRNAAASQRAAASAAAQQELAASAVPAAELARQAFLAKKRRNASDVGESIDVPLRGAGLRTGGLLGRGEDAATTPAHSQRIPDLPVLLGQHVTGPSRGDKYADAVTEKDTAELVRQAFLERQGRIMGRGAVRKVP